MRRMIPKKLVPDAIRDGNRFSEEIMRNNARLNFAAIAREHA